MFSLKIFLYWCLIYYFQDSNTHRVSAHSVLQSTRNNHQTLNTTEFQCSTGENIPTALVCNGIPDCVDDSDETWQACRRKYPKSCLLPKYANNISIASCTGQIATSEGGLVDELTLISVSFEPNGNRDHLQLLCFEGRWIPPSADANKQCSGLPTTTSEVEYLYYENGQKANSNYAHFTGSVIYPKCERGYPNARQATCDENGKWSVDHFDCLTCSDSHAKTLSFPMIQDTSFRKFVNCRVHYVSPYLVMTAAACFEDRHMSEYYVYLDGDEKKGDSIDPSKLVKIQKIHFYANSGEEENANHLALAEVEHRFPFSPGYSFVCLDYASNIEDTITEYGFDSWTFGKLDASYASGDIAYRVRILSCEDSTFPSSGAEENQGCAYLDDRYEIRRGAGFYVMGKDGRSYAKAVVINTSNGPRIVALFTGVAKYLDWINGIIQATNRDHQFTHPVASETAQYVVRNGSSSFQNFNVDCTNQKMRVRFVNGCVLPARKYVDYKFFCSRTKYQDYCQAATSTKFGVPEHTTLKHVKCKNQYTAYSSITGSSVCFQGAWYPPVPLCM